MASATSSSLLQTLHLPRANRAPVTACATRNPKRTSSEIFPGRRQWLLLLTASTAATLTRNFPAAAQDIPLFGLRKKLKKVEEAVEEAAEEILKESEEAVEKGIETAEKGIETAEMEIESAVSFGGLAQAEVVAGAELVGVLVASAVVNGILGPEAQKS